jgi:hypothetical protein
MASLNETNTKLGLDDVKRFEDTVTAPVQSRAQKVG